MIKLNQKSKKLLLLQRNELLTQRQKWLRKKFGRLLFTNIFIHFFQNKNLEQITEELFLKEIETFKNFLPKSVKKYHGYWLWLRHYKYSFESNL